MLQGLNFETVALPERTRSLREEVRAFLAEDQFWFPNSDFVAGESAESNKRHSEKSWIDITLLQV